MTNGSKIPDDAEISAWLDGMMDKEGSAKMTQLVASCEAVAARAARLQRIDELIRIAVPAEDTIPDALLQRLGLADPSPSATVVSLAAVREARKPASVASRPAVGRTRVWQVAAQVTLVIGLGTSLAVWQGDWSQRQDEASYRPLSDAARPSAIKINAIVMFTSGTSAASAHALVAASGGQLVGEPSDGGVWKLSLPADQRTAAIAALQADSRVTMAEPIDGEQK